MSRDPNAEAADALATMADYCLARYFDLPISDALQAKVDQAKATIDDWIDRRLSNEMNHVPFHRPITEEERIAQWRKIVDTYSEGRNR